MSRHEKIKRRKEQNKRSHVEGKFGQAKSKYGLDDIKMKRADTSHVGIIMILLALNVMKLAKELYFLIFSRCKSTWRQLVRRVRTFNFEWRTIEGRLHTQQAHQYQNLVLEAVTF